MMARKKVVGYLGHNIYLYDSGNFVCEIGENELKAETLQGIKHQIRTEVDTRMDVDAIYSGSGELYQAKVVKVTEGYRELNLILDSANLGIGVPGNTEPGNVYPLTEKNLKVLKEHKEMRDKGWNLIYKADGMSKNLEPFEKDFFYNKLKKPQLSEREKSAKGSGEK